MLQLRMVGLLVNTELGKDFKEVATAYSRYYPRIFLEELRKRMKDFVQFRPCASRDID
jgi:hypothetical protein